MIGFDRRWLAPILKFYSHVKTPIFRQNPVGKSAKNNYLKPNSPPTMNFIQRKKMPIAALIMWSSTAWCQRELPFPFSNISSLSPAQKRKIDSIHQRCAAELHKDYAQYKDTIIQYNTQRKTPFLTYNDTCRLYYSLRTTSEQKLLALSYPLLDATQQNLVNQLLAAKTYEINLDHFDKYKRMQKGGQLCWAACVQMLANYNGIECSQDDVIQLLHGSVIDDNASLEDLVTNIDGFHPAFKDPQHNDWLLDIRKMDSIPGDMLVGMMTPPLIFPGYAAMMITGNTIRMTLIAIHYNHLCIIHKIIYQGQPGHRRPITIIYYDPLLNRDVRLKWSEEYHAITNWFYCVAVTGNQIFFPNRKL